MNIIQLKKPNLNKIKLNCDECIDENLLEYFQLIVDAKTKDEDKYYNNRMKWIKIGMLIYSLDMPLSVGSCSLRIQPSFKSENVKRFGVDSIASHTH